MRKILFLCVIIVALIAGATAIYFTTMAPETPTSENPTTIVSPQNNTDTDTNTPKATDLGTFKKMDHDPYGIWQQPGAHFADIDSDRLSVYASLDSHYFFAIYTPTHPSERTLVTLHGTGGTAYVSIYDEMKAAEDMNMTIIALQWLDFTNNEYADTPTMNTLIDTAYQTLGDAAQGKSVLMGFSRGSAMIFKLAADDAGGKKRFTGIVANSGGIPKDGLIEKETVTSKAKAEQEKQEEMYTFYTSLNTGTAEPNIFEDQHFFLYCGLQDEEWGSEMCDNMDRAQTLVEKYGGTVDVFIRDAEGKHMGLTHNTDNYEQFLTWLGQITE